MGPATSAPEYVRTSARMPYLPSIHRSFFCKSLEVCSWSTTAYVKLTNHRAHACRDLHSYLCTFEHCDTADRMFESREEWLNHEMQAHWQNSMSPPSECILCGASITDVISYRGHIGAHQAQLASDALHFAWGIHPDLPDAPERLQQYLEDPYNMDQGYSYKNIQNIYPTIF